MPTAVDGAAWIAACRESNSGFRRSSLPRFENKTVVVTGGAQGIGRACVLAFAREGGVVMVADRDAEAAAATAQEVVAGGGIASAITCDVGRSTQVEALFFDVARAFGGVDILVNNAGVIRNGTVVEMNEADWDLMFDVNIKGMFLTCKNAIPQMRERGGGAIVNVASVSSFASTPASVAYSASKGAVVSFTRALAVDHAAENIRCNCVAPGSIQTPLLESSADYFAPDDPTAPSPSGDEHTYCVGWAPQRKWPDSSRSSRATTPRSAPERVTSSMVGSWRRCSPRRAASSASGSRRPVTVIHLAGDPPHHVRFGRLAAREFPDHRPL